MDLEGVVPPMCTPVTNDGSIDVATLAKYVEYLEESGVHGLFPLGSTGEFPSLTKQQSIRVIETTTKAAKNIPVYAGCGDTSFDNVAEMIESSYDLGADIAVVISPYFLPSNTTAHRSFFKRIADDSPLPILIYHIPKLTGVTLPIETIIQLSNNKNIVGIKDSTGDLPRLFRLIHETDDTFNVFQGAGPAVLSSYIIGADGGINGEANIVPQAMSKLYESVQKSNYHEAIELYSNVSLPIINTFSNCPSIPAIKYLAGKFGPELGNPIPPLPRLSNDQRQILDEAFSSIEQAI